jgi:hypothetical protein
MSGLVKTLFGGTDKSAQKAQTASNVESREYTREVTDQARGDISRILPQAAAMGDRGFTAALDLAQQSAPAQIQAFQSGNQGAQQALLSGLSGFNAGILGQPMAPLQMQQAQMPDMQALFAAMQRPQYNASTDAALAVQPNRFMLPGGSSIPPNLLGGMNF